jgi:hypothetical protein
LAEGVIPHLSPAVSFVAFERTLTIASPPRGGRDEKALEKFVTLLGREPLVHVGEINQAGTVGI